MLDDKTFNGYIYKQWCIFRFNFIGADDIQSLQNKLCDGQYFLFLFLPLSLFLDIEIAHSPLDFTIISHFTLVQIFIVH